MATDWKQLKNRFQEILIYCTEASTKLDHGMLRPACTEAGKEIFRLIKNEEIDIVFDSTFKEEPIVYDKQDTHGVPWNLEHFDDYWLCVLAFLGRKDIIIIGNKKLRRTKIPVLNKGVCWEAYYHETAVEESFFSDDLAYLIETCRASIQACNFIIKQQSGENVQSESKWHPPEGYIGAKTIQQDFKIPRSTLQSWQKKDCPDTVKAHPSQEVFYPIEWLNEKMRNHKHRKKK